jgi:hypothetical protein
VRPPQLLSAVLVAYSVAVSHGGFYGVIGVVNPLAKWAASPQGRGRGVHRQVHRDAAVARGQGRRPGSARSHCRIVLPLIHFTPESLTYLFGASIFETTMRPNPTARGRRRSGWFSACGSARTRALRNRFQNSRGACGTLTAAAFGKR